MRKLTVLILAVIIVILVGAIAYLKVAKKPSLNRSFSNESEISWEECMNLPDHVIPQTLPWTCITSDGRKAVKTTPVSTNLIRSIRTVPSGIEFEVTSDKEFPVRNELAVLRIGNKEFTLSRYPENGDTRTLIFTLTPEEFAQTATGDFVSLYYGRGNESSNERWNFGRLDKSILDKKR